VLTGQKAGDNAQLTALAEALPWPYTVKQLRYKATELLTNRLLGATLAGVERAVSSPLAAPWPDLVLTAGRRNEPVARWIKQQAPTTRLVHVGRPWAPLASFDLIVTTPQYCLPERPNILHNHLPLHGVNPARLAQAAARWRAEFDVLPRPWTALLVGGDSGPYVFTTNKGLRLGRLADRLARPGALLVTNSARTPAAAWAAVQAQIRVPSFQYQWRAGDADNPYWAYLALADRLIVTGESMSMLTEAAWTGKPLYLFDPGDAGPWWRQRHNFRFKPVSHRLAMRFAPRRMHRDVGNIQRRLVTDARAVWLGDTFPERDPQPPPDDMQRAVERVRALLAPI